jgi:protein-S-isoprenylcysteine O-methyltransferase Ste14
MFGWFLAAPAMATRRFGSRLWFGILCVIFAEAPRLILPLGFVSQPRFGDEGLLAPVGSIFLIGSLFFGTPVFRIGGFTKPNRVEPLRTDGPYAVVRHPLMLCDATWPLGWSLICGTVIGVALTPIWFIISYLVTEVEEEELVREYGNEYRDFQRRVPCLIPFVKRL